MISVVLTTELGKLLHQYGSFEKFPDRNQYLSLQKWLNEKKASLHPTFPENEAAQLQTYFRLTTRSKITGADLEALLQLPGIDGAYEKPSDDLPV